MPGRKWFFRCLYKQQYLMQTSTCILRESSRPVKENQKQNKYMKPSSKGEREIEVISIDGPTEPGEGGDDSISIIDLCSDDEIEVATNINPTAPVELTPISMTARNEKEKPLESGYSSQPLKNEDPTAPVETARFSPTGKVARSKLRNGSESVVDLCIDDETEIVNLCSDDETEISINVNPTASVETTPISTTVQNERGKPQDSSYSSQPIKNGDSTAPVETAPVSPKGEGGKRIEEAYESGEEPISDKLEDGSAEKNTRSVLRDDSEAIIDLCSDDEPGMVTNTNPNASIETTLISTPAQNERKKLPESGDSSQPIKKGDLSALGKTSPISTTVPNERKMPQESGESSQPVKIEGPTASAETMPVSTIVRNGSGKSKESGDLPQSIKNGDTIAPGKTMPVSTTAPSESEKPQESGDSPQPIKNGDPTATVEIAPASTTVRNGSEKQQESGGFHQPIKNGDPTASGESKPASTTVQNKSRKPQESGCSSQPTKNGDPTSIVETAPVSSAGQRERSEEPKESEEEPLPNQAENNLEKITISGLRDGSTSNMNLCSDDTKKSSNINSTACAETTSISMIVKNKRRKSQDSVEFSQPMKNVDPAASVEPASASSTVRIKKKSHESDSSSIDEIPVNVGGIVVLNGCDMKNKSLNSERMHSQTFKDIFVKVGAKKLYSRGQKSCEKLSIYSLLENKESLDNFLRVSSPAVGQESAVRKCKDSLERPLPEKSIIKYPLEAIRSSLQGKRKKSTRKNTFEFTYSGETILEINKVFPEERPKLLKNSSQSIESFQPSFFGGNGPLVDPCPVPPFSGVNGHWEKPWVEPSIDGEFANRNDPQVEPCHNRSMAHENWPRMGPSSGPPFRDENGFSLAGPFSVPPFGGEPSPGPSLGAPQHGPPPSVDDRLFTGPGPSFANTNQPFMGLSSGSPPRIEDGPTEVPCTAPTFGSGNVPSVGLCPVPWFGEGNDPLVGPMRYGQEPSVGPCAGPPLGAPHQGPPPRVDDGPSMGPGPGPSYANPNRPFIGLNSGPLRIVDGPAEVPCSAPTFGSGNGPSVGHCPGPWFGEGNDPLVGPMRYGQEPSVGPCPGPPLGAPHLGPTHRIDDRPFIPDGPGPGPSYANINRPFIGLNSGPQLRIQDGPTEVPCSAPIFGSGNGPSVGPCPGPWFGEGNDPLVAPMRYGQEQSVGRCPGPPLGAPHQDPPPIFDDRSFIGPGPGPSFANTNRSFMGLHPGPPIQNMYEPQAGPAPSLPGPAPSLSGPRATLSAKEGKQLAFRFNNRRHTPVKFVPKFKRANKVNDNQNLRRDKKSRYKWTQKTEQDEVFNKPVVSTSNSVTVKQEPFSETSPPNEKEMSSKIVVVNDSQNMHRDKKEYLYIWTRKHGQYKVSHKPISLRSNCVTIKQEPFSETSPSKEKETASKKAIRNPYYDLPNNLARIRYNKVATPAMGRVIIKKEPFSESTSLVGKVSTCRPMPILTHNTYSNVPSVVINLLTNKREVIVDKPAKREPNSEVLYFNEEHVRIKQEPND